MGTELARVSVKGKQKLFPSLTVGGATIVVSGKLIKTAAIQDEAWLPASGAPAPEVIIGELQREPRRPDLFTFAQKLPDVTPRYRYHLEWDNYATATIESHRAWFDNDIDRSVRKHLRKAEREGISTRVVAFDDELVAGISSIYNEQEIRQGKHFWHFGKSFEEVKKDNGTYLDTSVFVGAYFQDELVGFLKLVIVDDQVASIMQILAKSRYFDKRPNNALLSKAVEICESRSLRHLVYGQYVYGNKENSSLIDFKRKNGFQRVDVPRYYIPLTTSGRLALAIGVRELGDLLPGWSRNSLIALRSRYYRFREKLTKSGSSKDTHDRKTPPCQD